MTRYLLGKAEAYYCHQSYSEALETLHRAKGQEGDNPVIHYRIGSVHYAQEEYKASIRALKTCLAHMKDQSAKGHALGQTMGAKEVEKLRQQQLSSYYRIAIAYARLEKWERSLWPFTRCIQMDPSQSKYQLERGKVFQAL